MAFDFMPYVSTAIVPTAAQVLAGLESEGITGEAARLVVKIGAPTRHRGRVMQAVKAAYDATVGLGSGDSEFGVTVRAAGMAAVIVADIFGIGGENGLTGASTTRVAAFRSLGSGRKQAHDGGAWDAAIEEALSVTLAEVKADGVHFGWDEEEQALYLGLHSTARPNMGWVYLTEAGIAPAWIRTVAGRILLALVRGENFLIVTKAVTAKLEVTKSQAATAFNAVAGERF